MPHAICVCLLWLVTGGGWSDYGSVEQRSGIIRRDGYWHIADEKGNLVMYRSGVATAINRSAIVPNRQAILRGGTFILFLR